MVTETSHGGAPYKQRSIKQSATDAVDDERVGWDKDGLAKDG